MTEIEKVPIKAPSSVTWSLGEKVLGFGVWFAIGISPFLGNKDVPGFSSLLSMYPESMRAVVIPLASFLMGVMALVVDFAAARGNFGEDALWLRFKRTVAISVGSLLLLAGVYFFTVVRIVKTVSPTADVTLAFVTGTLSVPHQYPGSKCACLEGEAATNCLRTTVVTPENLDNCFGSARIAVATLVLTLLYLLLTGSFVAAVGLQILYQKQAAITAARSRSAPTSTPPP